MSELISLNNANGNFRGGLLTNVSRLALLGMICAPAATALASQDADRPTVWIELGGGLARVDSPQGAFAPQFLDLASPQVLYAVQGAQRPSRYSPSLDGKITFTPESSPWVFSVSATYGRTKNSRHIHYQSPGIPTFVILGNGVGVNHGPFKPPRMVVGDGQTNLAESHLLIDFRAGRDVGLGLFGDSAASVVSAGVRYAQFTSGSGGSLHARPVYGFGAPIRHKTTIGKYATGPLPFRQSYTAVVHATRNSHAVGPSVSWDASVPVAGHEDGLTVAFDWGLNAAALFGRQKVHEDHKTSGYHLYYNGVVKHVVTYVHPTVARDRSRSIFVPNVGGFAGISLKFPNAKISLGYRGDFFFNAMDMGIDARDESNRNFYGPFATVSIGLGG